MVLGASLGLAALFHTSTQSSNVPVLFWQESGTSPQKEKQVDHQDSAVASFMDRRESGVSLLKRLCSLPFTNPSSHIESLLAPQLNRRLGVPQDVHLEGCCLPGSSLGLRDQPNQR